MVEEGNWSEQCKKIEIKQKCKAVSISQKSLASGSVQFETVVIPPH
jgi:hypothetical protein